jgi:hypothetical protein
MDDAVVALQSAIDELRMAQDSLDDELAEEVRQVMQRTQLVLDAVRTKMQAG